MTNLNAVSTEAHWLSALATSMQDEHDYAPQVEGAIPPGLKGTLFRNGPGRFELGGVRKKHLLDGDGMIQAFDLDAGHVRYRNRYVRTEKYIAEEAAGKLIFPTWTTRSPRGLLSNVGNRIKSQAGVTAVVKNNMLYAFDEVGLPYGLDPDTLQTLGQQAVGEPTARVDYKAHTKTDGHTGGWILLGVTYGHSMHLHIAEHNALGSLRFSQRVPAPRSAYFHDWFATQHYIVVSLQPVQPSFARFLTGLDSFTDSMRWRPDKGNLLMVIDRNAVQPPVIIPAPPTFMWHALNAYEIGNSIVADFVGYDAPDHFLGEHAAFRAIMDGRGGDQNYSSTLRRYIINLSQRSAVEEIVSNENHEFPMIAPERGCTPHRYGYFTTARGPTVFHNGLARVDMNTGAREVFHMGDKAHLGEPIFVPDPKVEDGEQGWLLSVGLDGATGRSFLAILLADRIADGPIAVLRLRHPTPLSFHGWWKGQGHV